MLLNKDVKELHQLRTSYNTNMQMLATFTNPTIYDVRRDLVPRSKITTHNCVVT